MPEKDPKRLADENNVVKFLISDRDHPSSILSSLAAARENLRTTRDAVPQEAWEQINGLRYLRPRPPTTRRGRYEFLRQVIRNTQQISGLLDGAMSRTAAYEFVHMGRYLERGYRHDHPASTRRARPTCCRAVVSRPDRRRNRRTSPSPSPRS